MGKFVIKQAKSGPMFNLKAGNGEVILSSQVYADEKSCRNGIESIMKNAPVAEIEDQTKEGFETVKNPKFEVYTDKSGETRFRLKASNGQVIGTGEGYASKAGCLKGIESIKKNAADAEIVVEE
ncbi:MAG: YegP family protein [Lachnospiraceae bacterium]|nr:YegP family protein [Lachnospiraceae bacterium]